MGNLAGRLAGQRHDLLGALLVAFPQLDPFAVHRALFRRRDHRLIGLADLGVGLDDGGQRLFRRQLFFQRLAQHVLADHVAIGDDAGAELAEHADARQPARRDIDRVGVDGPHVLDREQTHARHGDEQEGNHGDDLGADRVLREHGAEFLGFGRAGNAPDGEKAVRLEKTEDALRRSKQMRPQVELIQRSVKLRPCDRTSLGMNARKRSAHQLQCIGKKLGAAEIA